MLSKGFRFFTTRIEQLNSWTVFSILFGTAFFLRFPFFFRDYVDRDESTFILMGQSWVNGYLPYTQLWDLKPPIAFLFFAGIIAAFGKSFWAIRFFGTLCVTISAFFTFRIGALFTAKRVALGAAAVCVFLQSAFGSLQGVMSEHICMTFFMAGLFVLLRYTTLLWYGVAGLLLGASVMVKINMAYAILFIGFFWLYQGYVRKEILKSIWEVTSLGTGIVIVVLLTFLPYYLSDLGSLWWNSVVQAPLEYADARRHSYMHMAPTLLITFGFFAFAWKTKWLNFRDTRIQLLLVVVIGVLFAFVRGGRINGHYLIQLYPIILVPTAIVVANLKRIRRLKLYPYGILILLLLPMESYLEYYAITKNKIENGTFYNGEGFTAPIYVKQNGLDTKNIFFTEYHIGYWILEANPPTKAATHPSNIGRAETFPFYGNPRKTGLEELQFIMDSLKPETVVTANNRPVFDPKLVRENKYIKRYLAQHYKRRKIVDGALIYQRLKGK